MNALLSSINYTWLKKNLLLSLNTLILSLQFHSAYNYDTILLEDTAL